MVATTTAGAQPEELIVAAWVPRHRNRAMKLPSCGIVLLGGMGVSFLQAGLTRPMPGRCSTTARVEGSNPGGVTIARASRGEGATVQRRTIRPPATSPGSSNRDHPSSVAVGDPVHAGEAGDVLEEVTAQRMFSSGCATGFASREKNAELY